MRVLVGILVFLHFYRFFGDKTGSSHFQGLVPNLFIIKPTISPGMSDLSAILVYFRFELVVVHQENIPRQIFKIQNFIFVKYKYKLNF